MNILEMLSSPLAHGADLNAIARSTLKMGSASDVEWLLVGLTLLQEHLVRAKYQLDKQAMHSAWSMLYAIAIKRRWKESDQTQLIYDLSGEVINEWVDPKICSRCEGVGSVLYDSKVIFCKRCNGNGRRDLSDYMIKRRLALRSDSSTNVWVGRYREIMATVDNEEHMAIHHMVKRLKGVKSRW